jgi:hypothetical protein
MHILDLLLCITLVWIALGLACALRVACRRRTGESQVAGDPFFFPFGQSPGFSDAQLRRIAPQVRTRDPLRRSFSHGPFTHPAGLALRTDAGSDGSNPSGPAAARNLLRGPRHG